MQAPQALRPLDIALFTHRMHKDHNMPISDLAQSIYNSYMLSFYRDYTIVELMDFLNSQPVIVNCKLNKESIISFIHRYELQFPALPEADGEWYVDKNYGLWYHKYFAYFKVRMNDIFNVNNIAYKLVCIKPLPKQQFKTQMDYVIVLKNIINKTNIKISLSSFIELLKRDDVIYEHSAYFDDIQEFFRMRQTM